MQCKPKLRLEHARCHVTGEDVVNVSQPHQPRTIERILITGENDFFKTTVCALGPVHARHRLIQFERRCGGLNVALHVQQLRQRRESSVCQRRRLYILMRIQQNLNQAHLVTVLRLTCGMRQVRDRTATRLIKPRGQESHTGPPGTGHDQHGGLWLVALGRHPQLIQRKLLIVCKGQKGIDRGCVVSGPTGQQHRQRPLPLIVCNTTINHPSLAARRPGLCWIAACRRQCKRSCLDS